MQLINLPTLEKLVFIEKSIQKERILRYLPAADMDLESAFALYIWNCSLCESFYVSLHFAEIVCRNAINKRLVAKCGDRWFENNKFQNLMNEHFRKELKAAIAKEAKQHGSKLTTHHIVSALTFAFWEHTLTKRFDRLLWLEGIHVSFPNAPSNITREKLHALIETVRRWRNRIAHHQAIFDKKPMKKHQDVLCLVQWACEKTGDWVASSSKVPLIISKRPKQKR